MLDTRENFNYIRYDIVTQTMLRIITEILKKVTRKFLCNVI